MKSETEKPAMQADRLLRVQEVGHRLGVSARQCWKLLASGRLPAPVRLGRSVRWRDSDIARFVRDGCPSRDEAAGVRP
ncbi:MAG: AlpA family phage regulatory protein [Phycisphaerae bacterium]|nr:AlpA family phage regulatory protein [Phycisphaerae bacterium]